MSRKITISKHEGNTHFSISVFDSYNKEHHLGYCTYMNEENAEEINESAEEIWNNEVKPEEDLLSNAIKACNELDKENGLLRGNSDGLD